MASRDRDGTAVFVPEPVLPSIQDRLRQIRPSQVLHADSRVALNLLWHLAPLAEASHKIP